MGNDYTLFALKPGRVKFHENRRVEILVEDQ